MPERDYQILEIIDLEPDCFDDFEALSLCYLAATGQSGQTQVASAKAVSLIDQARYHSALVTHGVGALGREPESAAVLGGGDGIAVMELLPYESITSITHVADPAACGVVVSGDSFNDSRVKTESADALSWLGGGQGGTFDLIVVDMSADSFAGDSGFYKSLHRSLSSDGVATVQATFGTDAGQGDAVSGALSSAGFQVSQIAIPLEKIDGANAVICVAKKS